MTDRPFGLEAGGAGSRVGVLLVGATAAAIVLAVQGTGHVFDAIVGVTGLLNLVLWTIRE